LANPSETRATISSTFEHRGKEQHDAEIDTSDSNAVLVRLLGTGPGGRGRRSRIWGRSRRWNRCGSGHLGESGRPKRKHESRRRKYGYAKQAERPKRFHGNRSAEQSWHRGYGERSRCEHAQRSEHFTRHNAAWSEQLEPDGESELPFERAQYAHHSSDTAERESRYGCYASVHGWQYGPGDQRLDDRQRKHDRNSSAADVTSNSRAQKGARYGLLFLLHADLRTDGADAVRCGPCRPVEKKRPCVSRQCR